MCGTKPFAFFASFGGFMNLRFTTNRSFVAILALLSLLLLAACQQGNQPEAAFRDGKQVKKAFDPVASVTSLSTSSSPIRVAGVGANFGNQAANQIFSSGDLSGSVVRINAITFNSMTVEQLRANYDVLLFTWASPSQVNADWDTRLLPFMALGGGIVFEDDVNIIDLAAVVTKAATWTGSPVIISPVAGLTDGIINDLTFPHMLFSAWSPSLAAFITHDGIVGGLWGKFGSGCIVLTGADNDYHGKRSENVHERNMYNLLLNEVQFVSSGCSLPASDTTPPETTITANPSSLTNSASASLGFSGTDGVTSAANLTFECSLDGAAFSTCTSPQAYSNLSDGSHTFEARAVDAAGNVDPTPASYTWTVDTTPPTLNPAVSPNPILLNGNVMAIPNATDATSGIATQSCDAVPTNSVGSNSVSCTATDNGGNSASTTVDYSVVYGFSGFSQPVDNNLLNKAKAGQSIPLKWRLTDANGAPVSNLAGVQLTVASLSCTSGTTPDAIEEYASGSSGLQNLGDGFYQYNWKTPTTYAGSCKTLRLDMGEGLFRTAAFQFTR
jgi:hypothetical protein